MHFGKARAPIALVLMLVLGVWAGSAFADGVVTTVTDITTTVVTDTTGTSPGTGTTGTTDTTSTDTTTSGGGGGVTSTVPTVTVPTVTVPTVTVPTVTVPKPPVTTATVPTTPPPPRPRPKPKPKPKPPVVTTPPKTTTVPTTGVGGGQVTTPVITSPGSSTTPTGTGLGTGISGPSASQPANEPSLPPSTAAGAIAAGLGAGANVANTPKHHKAKAPKKHRLRRAGTSASGTRSHARGGTSKPSGTRHASSVSKKTKAAAARAKAKAKAKLLRVKPLRLTPKAGANTSSPANGGRESTSSTSPVTTAADHAAAPGPVHEDHGIGIDTPVGPFSISPTGFQVGGHEQAIASVGGILTAVLVTIAALAAFAAASGAVALARRFRRTRAAMRTRSAVLATPRRTREQLYSEARRQNLPGRSSMTKAELERALYPPPPADAGSPAMSATTVLPSLLKMNRLNRDRRARSSRPTERSGRRQRP